MQRHFELDALRGVMLLLIAATHLPTRLAERMTQPVGYVSAAEGFVFLSAFLAGAVYTHIAADKGLTAMRRALWRRTRTIYACHAGMLVFLFTAVAALGINSQQRAITNLMSFYLHDPVTALWTAFALIYNPPLLDILPMYVIFMLATPLLLTIAAKHGWREIVLCSLAAWALAQVGLAKALHAAVVAATGLTVPLQETGAFQITAWQWMWVLGLWLGSESVSAARRSLAFPRGLVACAAAIVALGLLGRHGVGLWPFGDGSPLNMLIDKWQLGPARMLNFLAILVLAVAYGPALARRVRIAVLEQLGAASLPVFCAQLAITLLLLCEVGDRRGELPLWGELAMLAGTFAAMVAVAQASSRWRARSRAAVPVTRPAISAGAV